MEQQQPRKYRIGGQLVSKQDPTQTFDSYTDAYNKGAIKFENTPWNDPVREEQELDQKAEIGRQYRKDWNRNNPSEDPNAFDRAHSIPFSDPIPVEEDRGFIRDVGSHLGRGTLQAIGAVGHAMSVADGNPDNGGIGRDVVNWSDQTMRENPEFAPDQGEVQGTDGTLRKTFMGAVESLPMSAAPFVAGAVGSMASPVVGVAAGTATLGAMFGAGQYGASRQEAMDHLDRTRPDLSPEEKKALAHTYGLKNAFYEAGTELASDIIATMSFGASRVVGAPVEQTLKQFLKPTLGESVKEFAKAFAKSAPAEVISEEIASWGQLEAGKDIGMGDGFTAQAALETGLTAMWMSGGIGLGLHGYNEYQRRTALNNINSQDYNQRVNAVDTIAQNIAGKDKQVAKAWYDQARQYIENGQEIPIDEKRLSLIADQLRSDDRLHKANPVSLVYEDFDFKGQKYQIVRYRTVDELMEVAQNPAKIKELKTTPEDVMFLAQERAYHDELAKVVGTASPDVRRGILDTVLQNPRFNEDILKQSIKEKQDGELADRHPQAGIKSSEQRRQEPGVSGNGGSGQVDQPSDEQLQGVATEAAPGRKSAETADDGRSRAGEDAGGRVQAGSEQKEAARPDGSQELTASGEESFAKEAARAVREAKTKKTEVEERKSLGLSMSQYNIFKRVRDAGGPLGLHSQLKDKSLKGHVEALEKKGFIEKTPEGYVLSGGKQQEGVVVEKKKEQQKPKKESVAEIPTETGYVSAKRSLTEIEDNYGIAVKNVIKQAREAKRKITVNEAIAEAGVLQKRSSSSRKLAAEEKRKHNLSARQQMRLNYFRSKDEVTSDPGRPADTNFKKDIEVLKSHGLLRENDDGTYEAVPVGGATFKQQAEYESYQPEVPDANRPPAIPTEKRGAADSQEVGAGQPVSEPVTDKQRGGKPGDGQNQKADNEQDLSVEGREVVNVKIQQNDNAVLAGADSDTQQGVQVGEEKSQKTHEGNQGKDRGAQPADYGANAVNDLEKVKELRSISVNSANKEELQRVNAEAKRLSVAWGFKYGHGISDNFYNFIERKAQEQQESSTDATSEQKTPEKQQKSGRDEVGEAISADGMEIESRPIGDDVKFDGETLVTDNEKKVTDAAEKQKIENSIKEGLLIIKSGKFNGKEQDLEHLLATRKAVESAKEKIGDNTPTPDVGRNDEFRYSVNDIPYDLAYNAYYASSFSPDKRAQSERQGYLDGMANEIEKLSKYAKTPEQKAELADWFNGVYRPGYVKRLKAKLQADSRTMSSMITGPANFPTRSNQKKLDTAHRRLEELLEWDKKVVNRMRAKLQGSEAISSTDPDAISKLKDKLAKAEKAQEVMKEANKIVRNSKLSDADKIEQLKKLGITKEPETLLKPDFGNRIGFASYALQNNNAEIKRLRGRIAELEKREVAAEATGGSETFDFDGGSVEINHADGFLRVYHEEKPSADVRTELKKNGFRWSPRDSAWRRKLTENAKWAAERVTSVKLSGESLPSAAEVIKSETGRAYIIEDLARFVYSRASNLQQYISEIKSIVGNAFKSVANKFVELYHKFNAHLDKVTTGAQAGNITVGKDEPSPQAQAAYREEESWAVKQLGGKLKNAIEKKLPAEIVHGKAEMRFWEPILSSFEYIAKKAGASQRVYEANSKRHDAKYQLGEEILGDFVPTMESAEKNNKPAFKEANDYVLLSDRYGKGYSIRRVKGFEVGHPGGGPREYWPTKTQAYDAAQKMHGGWTEEGKKPYIKDFLLSEEEGEWWQVLNPEDVVVNTFANEQEAVTTRQNLEHQALVTNGVKIGDKRITLSKDAADLVLNFRQMTDRAFDKMVADMRAVLAKIREMGMDEPTLPFIDESKRFVLTDKKGNVVGEFGDEETARAVGGGKHTLKRREDGEIRKEVSLSEAIAMISDLRGTYYPRQRQSGAAILRATKPGENPILEKFDLYITDKSGANKENGEIIQKPGWVTKGLNFATGFIPIAKTAVKRARELKKLGYEVTIVRDDSVSEDIFEATNLATSMEALLQAGIEKARKMDDAAMAEFNERANKLDKAIKKLEGDKDNDLALQELRIARDRLENERPETTNEKYAKELNKILTANIADIFKARGYMASRMHRAAEYHEGFETNMLLAGVRYAKGLAGGIAKRDAAQQMLSAVVGRDIQWIDFKAEFLEKNPMAKETEAWDAYEEMVAERRLDPEKQPKLYAMTMAFIKHVLRNEEQVDRITGVMKGLAVTKFLGFRISSAAVNATNMVQAVPATISSHTGRGMAQAFNAVKNASAAYYQYRTGKASAEDRAIFQEISANGWDEAQFNAENAAVLKNKASRAVDKWFITPSMYMFGAVEKANRAITIFAAYKEFSQSPDYHGLSHEELMKKAKHTSDRAHGDYDKGTLPSWAWGSGALPHVAQMAATFTKFSQNYALNMGEMWGKGDYKQFAHMLLAPAVLAGAGASMASPVVFALAKALGLGGDDPEEAFYDWIVEMFGGSEYAGRIARHGLGGAVGVNLKGSIQMNNPLPTNLQEVFGAPGAVVFDMKKGLDHLRRAEFLKASEAFLPTAFGNAVKASREGMEGITTGSYSPVYYGDEPLKSDPVDFAIRFIGFNPSRISGIREKQWNEKQVKAKYTEKREEINSKIKRFFLFGSGDWAKILKDIQHYNELASGSGRNDISFITNRSISALLRRSMTPSKIEQQR